MLRNRFHCVDQMGASVGFEDVTLRSRFKNISNELLALSSSEDDYLTVRRCAFNLARDFESSQIGHAHVENGDVRMQLFGSLHGFTTSFRDATNLPTRLVL